MARRPHPALKPRRTAYRRGADTKWQVWWPILVTMATFASGLIGVYIGVSNQLAVQRVEIAYLQRTSDEAKADLRQRIVSLESNMRGIESYIVQLHNNEERRTR